MDVRRILKGLAQKYYSFAKLNFINLLTDGKLVGWLNWSRTEIIIIYNYFTWKLREYKIQNLQK